MISCILNINRLRPETLFFRSFAVIALIWIIMVSGAAAQSFNIVDIGVEGNKTASASLITSVSSLSKGDQLSATSTQDAVRRLYQLGFFRDVRLEAEEVTGGLILTIRVVELPKLTELRFSGNKKIKSKDLRKEVDLTINGVISPGMVFEKKQVLLDKYAEKGYFLAAIESRYTYSDDSSEVALEFKINEGSKVKVDEVILSGNERIRAGDIIGKMRNRKRGFLRSSNFDKEKYPEDKEKIIDYLHQKGYIDAYLKSDSFAIDTSTNRMKIYLDIYEGPRYYFGKATFSGNEILNEKALASVLKHSEGQVFDLEKYDESIYEVYFIYQEQGYLHVRVLDERTTRDSLIDMNFEIVEGLPSEVNLVKIIGNTRTHENVIRREMIIRPGQVFHRSLLIRSIRNVMQLNYFGNVTPDIKDLPSGDVDVVVEVEEKPTGQVSAGAGYSGQDKFVGTFGLGIPNFRGMGQALNFNVDIGSRRNSYSVSFTEPWVFGTPTLMGLDLYYTNRRWYEDYTEGRRGGSIRVGRRLKWPDDYFRVYLRYRLEDDRYYDFSDDYRLTNSVLNVKNASFDSLYYEDPEQPAADSQKTLSYNIYEYGSPLPNSLERFGEKWFSASSLTLSITRDSRDLPEFATSGSVVSYTGSVTGSRWLGGYWDYQKHQLEVSKFIPLYKSIALAGKVSFGAIFAPSDNLILEFDRYSPGGTGYDGIVRGYDDGSLTPDTTALSIINNSYYNSIEPNVRPDLTAEPDSMSIDTTVYKARVRGKFMLVGNLELQVPLLKDQFYFLLFLDAGNSWLRKEDIRLRDVYRGYGAGFRLIVPGIGTIGFDFGYPLDDRVGQSKGWKPHFQIGTTFR